MVIPADVRAAIAQHARDEAPNESCGLVVLDGDRATEYIPGINRSASPYRFDLYIDPVVWSELEGEQAVVHSHLSSPPRPSRTDVENIGLWEGKPYLIYSVREDDLAAWTIQDGQISPIELR